MPEGITGAVWAFCWGLAAASGVFGGTILGLIAQFPCQRRTARVGSCGRTQGDLISSRITVEIATSCGAINLYENIQHLF